MVLKMIELELEYALPDNVAIHKVYQYIQLKKVVTWKELKEQFKGEIGESRLRKFVRRLVGSGKIKRISHTTFVAT